MIHIDIDYTIDLRPFLVVLAAYILVGVLLRPVGWCLMRHLIRLRGLTPRSSKLRLNREVRNILGWPRWLPHALWSWWVISRMSPDERLGRSSMARAIKRVDVK